MHCNYYFSVFHFLSYDNKVLLCLASFQCWNVRIINLFLLVWMYCLPSSVIHETLNGHFPPSLQYHVKKVMLKMCNKNKRIICVYEQDFSLYLVIALHQCFSSFLKTEPEMLFLLSAIGRCFHGIINVCYIILKVIKIFNWMQVEHGKFI